MLNPNRFFSPEATHRSTARGLYDTIKDLPLICPHGHVDPKIFSTPEYDFGSPTDLLITPDHYIFRMLYSQGITLESLGIPSTTHETQPVSETNPRDIWQLFAENFYLFQGTPTGIWLNDELKNIFGVDIKLDRANAQEIYDHIDKKLRSPDFQPRALFETFNIEVLCTTDSASDSLEHHQKIRNSDWEGRILPSFRPDTLTNLSHPKWRCELGKLENLINKSISSYADFIEAIESRRAFFKSMGAVSTDHASLTAFTMKLTPMECENIFQRALKNEATEQDQIHFSAHILIEMARMSIEDGLVMQIHVGSYRDHNPIIAQKFGSDQGADIPIRSEFTQNLKTLIDLYGNDARLTLVLFNLDETTYARELAPLAGHYPALRVGPPWWFHDSLNGMRRYFDQIMETAGIYNTAGFNDDTRAYPSIPARHDLWRRASADWVAGLLVRHIIDETDALQMVKALAYDLAKSTYKL